MHNSKEYLFLGILSYFNFPKIYVGEKVGEALKKMDLKKCSTNDNLLKNDMYFKGEKFFLKEMDDWIIYKIDNRTGKSSKNLKSGFYAMIFKKNNRYVISYRGSETFPLKEAYRDFIETDLLIGLGKRPLQFFEGVEIFEGLLKDGVNLSQISLTGHSLGGGIAQFVAIMSYKKYMQIPLTYTWNSVGIRRDGIVNLNDFLDYEKVLDKCGLTKSEKIIFRDFEESYNNFITKELKKNKIIKDRKTLLVDKNYDFKFSMTQEFIDSVAKQTNLKDILKRIPFKRKKELFLKKNFVEELFGIDEIVNKIYSSIKFQELINENKIFQDKIVNFCHSKDLVSFLFPHIGTTYQVDLNFLKKETIRFNKVLQNFNIFSKSIQNYHFEDVFIPFLDNNGMFSKDLSINYIASAIRRLIYKEVNFDREFLESYYLKKSLEKENYLEQKKKILFGMKKTKEDILYKEKIFNQIEKMEYDEVKKLWNKIINKAGSPYINTDIYDLIIFRENYY
ncbi:hypothetical protein [Fusobacterium sp. MFO224]|uniref:hypothetical protein n=1 Tax=Fusobacterium sp. MFO224 TaxID=3378070 RepID=UPI003852D6C4